MSLLSRVLLFVVGWLVDEPEPSDERHMNVAGMTCQGLTPEGETCEPCDLCQHPTCGHLRNGTCLACDREDGFCRS